MTSRQSPEERRKADELKAAYEDAQRVAAAAEEARVRKVCKLGDSAPVFVLGQDDVRARCKSKVRDLLKVPSTADFSYDATPLLSDDGGCRLLYKSTVEAQNAFGVKVRNRFTCAFDQRSGEMTAAIE